MMKNKPIKRLVKLKVNLRHLQTDSTSSLIFVVSFLFGGRVSSVGRALDRLEITEK